MHKSIEKLWEQVLKGDMKSWEIIVRRYNPLILAVAKSHGLRSADLDDCAQITWLALYQGRFKIEKALSIPTWLVRVAKRKAQRIQLKAKSRLSAEEQFDSSKVNLSPEDLYLQALESARVHTAIEMLDPRCRKLLHQLFLASEEQSYAEIAKSLKLAVNSLGPIRSRCLNRLKVILENLET